MIKVPDVLKVLNSFNINSKSYGPTLYENNNNVGICIDIKDKTFGFLTRAFTFNDIPSLEDFLKKYSWYRNNKDRFNIDLVFDRYDTPTPSISYYCNNEELSFQEMTNLKEIIDEKKEQKIEDETKEIYLKNVEYLTSYLIDLKNKKHELKIEKNNYKVRENDLKFNLLEVLSKYYNQQRVLIKPNVTLDNVVASNDAILLDSNLKNIRTKSLEDVTNYLKTLIDITKYEEIDKNYLLNIYSNNVYEYNIDILNKQIEFVKSKIIAEKNFNIQGSTIHNIDAELKSFLNTNTPPPKANIFLQEHIEEINNKYSNIGDLRDAYNIISKSNSITYERHVEEPKAINKDLIIKDLEQHFNLKSKEEKACLILYNSFYKSICNYIIDNNYPNKEDIKSHIDYAYYYEEFAEIVYNANNNHYLVNYFSVMNFKTIDTFIDSLINICRVLERSLYNLISSIKAFSLNENTTYKFFSLNPMNVKNDLVYLVNIPINTKLIYIPEKIILDDETKEFSLIKTANIYLRGNIIVDNQFIKVHKYQKNSMNYNKSDIIITDELVLKEENTFHLAEVKGEF